MAQHDYVIANDTAANVRADINDALAAIASNNSGSTEPTTTYANQWWYDTANNLLKIRAEANDAWITVAYLDQASDTFRILDDTQVVNTSGTQTGLIGDQAQATWETGTGTTESLVSPAKIAAAITAQALTSPTITSPDIDLGSDATGDILYRDSGGSIARLGIGSTDQVLKVASGLPSWGDAGGGGGLQSMQVFTSSGTWTRPAGITKVKVYATGGGGGATNNPPYAGGAGATAIKIIDVSSIASATITVGSGGGAYGNGGNSVWSDGTNTVTGGGGIASGDGGTSTGGDINLRGGEGSRSTKHADSFWGGAQRGDVTAASPTGYGQGGIYGTSGSIARNGAPGIVVIEEYA